MYSNRTNTMFDPSDKASKLPSPLLIKDPPGIVERAALTRDRQGYIKDLSQLTMTDLLELRDREKKLLSNKKRLDRLPDKGARIKEFFEKIVNHIKVMDDVDRAAEIFSELNIASVGRKAMNKMEWTGTYAKSSNQDMALDSDDDEDDENIDPLKIIANSHDTVKIVKIIKPEPNLVTEEDLKDIEEFKAKIEDPETKTEDNSDLEPHANYLCGKEIIKPATRQKFMPYKTTKTNVHDPENEKERGKHHHWENSAATPPTIVHGAAKCLSLGDSIHIQMEKNEVLKKAQEEYAMERLNQRLKIKDTINKELNVEKKIHGPLFEGYREKNEGYDEEEKDDEEDDEVDLIESDNNDD